MFRIGAIALALAFSATIATAQTTYLWNSSASDWGTSTSWTPNTVPTAADIALFNSNGAAAGTTVVNPVLTADFSVLSLTFGLNQNLGDWSVTQDATPRTLTIGGTGSTGITVYGPANTTFNGPLLTGASATNTLAMNVNSGSTLTLTGSTRITGNQGNTIIRGGTFRLDNAATNLTNRVNASGTIFLQGGAVYDLVGNAAGGTYNVGLLNNVDNSVGGFNTIRVTPNSTTANTVLNFANTGTFSLRSGTRNATLFEATSGELGSANGPRITFVGTPFTGSGGLLNNTSGGQTPGFGIVKDSLGTNFATYSTTAGIGIVSIASSVAKPTGATITTVTTAAGLQGLTAVGAANAGSNAQFDAPSGTITATANIAAATLRISPTVSGGVLSLGTNSLLVPGIMLDGAIDFTIASSSTTPSPSFGGTKYLYVNNPNTTLSFAGNLTSAGNQVLMAGPGFLDLTNTALQNTATTARINVAGGVLRVSEANFGLTATGGGQLNLTGGVLEIKAGGNGTGIAADFRRTLGTGTGTVNWGSTLAEGASGSEKGSGGFSAFGNAASVNVGGLATPATLQWNTVSFVNDGFALRFGSTKATALITWYNPLNLVNGTAYQLREINVVDNTAVLTDIASINAVISGSTAAADLIKTGDGVLHLDAANTYLGKTFVHGGRLNINNTPTGGAFVVRSGATLGGTGTIAANIALLPGATIRGGLTTSGVLTINTTDFQAGSIVGVTVVDGNTTAAYSSGSSTTAISVNTRLVKAGGATPTLTGINVSADLNNTTFINVNSSYSYLIGTGFGDQTGLNINDPARFTFTNTGNIIPTLPSLSGDGTGNLYLNFAATPVPEPIFLGGLCMLAFGVFRRRR